MSNQEQEELEQIYKQIEDEQDRQNKFLKIDPGDTRILKFNPKATKVIDREFEGKKSRRVNYEVTTAENPLDVKIVGMSLSNAVSINAFLKKGITTIEVRRKGSGLDTKYTFTPGG